jgi:hypothetical protein
VLAKFNDTHEPKSKRIEKINSRLKEAGLSKDSVVTSSSVEFERIPTPRDGETERNGPKRKWFKGFRWQ